MKEYVNASHAIVESPLQTTSQSTKTSETPITSSVNESPSLPSESQEPSSISEPLVSVSNVPESSSATKDSQSSFVPPNHCSAMSEAAPRPNVKPKRRTRKSSILMVSPEFARGREEVQKKNTFKEGQTVC